MTPNLAHGLGSRPSWAEYVAAREYRANSGGPASRTRTERLRSSVLGQTSGAIRCPCVLRIGIDFGNLAPLDCVEAWLRACGFDDEQTARESVALPAGPLICRSDEVLRPEAADTLAPSDGLRLALVLGLSTPWLYDPGRPVLWTRTSLTRRLSLFEGRGFYA